MNKIENTYNSLIVDNYDVDQFQLLSDSHETALNQIKKHISQNNVAQVLDLTPEQNPVEDLWLQTKNFVRKFHYLCPSFRTVKWLFEFFAQGQIFDFPKLFMYGILPQPI